MSDRYKARAKSATARREVARNVLQSLIAEGGFDWAEDDELLEVMLALGEGPDTSVAAATDGLVADKAKDEAKAGPPPSQDMDETAVRPNLDA